MSELARDEQWQRLDPRMLLVHPIREVVRFLPVLVGIFLAGTATGGGNAPWHLLGILIPVALGLGRYLTTSFRVADGRIELRRGLLNRHVLSTPVDRVRTVDLTASPIHRVLGLTTVRVGTGTASTDEDDRLDLDGLPVVRARQLRADLLHATSAGRGPRDGPRDGDVDGDPVTAGENEQVVLRFDPAWTRFAPLTSTGVVLAAGVVGLATQLLNTLGAFDRLDPRGLFDGASGLSLWALVPVGLVALLVIVSGLAIGGYLVTNWGTTLSHTRSDGSWHLRRGLFTTRETSLDDDRVSGVCLSEPLGIRLAGGAQLSAIVTGLDRKQRGSSLLVPPAPRSVVAATARAVLGVAGPVDHPLVGHGRRARNRRFSRALAPATLVMGALVLAVLLDDASRWLLVGAALAPVVGVGLAVDRWRALGHALTDGHLVASSGSLDRRREALATADIIGWNLRSTWFQRRAGLTSLLATTAGGRQSVLVLDLPEEAAVALAGDAVPGLVEQFLAPVGTGG